MCTTTRVSKGIVTRRKLVLFEREPPSQVEGSATRSLFKPTLPKITCPAQIDIDHPLASLVSVFNFSINFFFPRETNKSSRERKQSKLQYQN